MFYGNVFKSQIKIIHPFRKIQSRLEEFKDELHGNNTDDDTIIDDLAALQNPSHDKLEDSKKFDEIQLFLRRVLKNDNVKINIPHDKKTILVDMDNRTLPIEALGTGIHELVIIAVQSVILEKSVICIEEPELHFHPELQRQLMSFLYRETSNQYFFTTHSAHIMDAVPCSVTNVYMEDGRSRTNAPFTRQDKRMILHDMGYRSSDLLQANCIIWVEGLTCPQNMYHS